MNARFAPPVAVTLARADDVDGWRTQARALALAGVSPERVRWQVAGEADLFGRDGGALPPAGTGTTFRIARALMDLLRTALLHSDPERFALAYRVLWRSLAAPRLSDDPADPDMIALRALAKSVRRDIHKMHAFVRFRKTGDRDGRECFAAWFEPDHHITRAVAGFFRNRFAGMDWVIVTPEASIAWNGTALSEGPGGTRADVPGVDAVEAEWREYYASIFNPARVKIAAMKREMPVRYWRNLPEAALIPVLIGEAGQRVEAMMRDEQDSLPLFGEAAAKVEAAPTRRFESLDALYAALRRDDRAPDPGFSDQIVPGEGPSDARIMLVGEQPGDQEDIQRRPFVGPAGQLLDGCLAEAGIDRSRIFLTNAVKRFKFEQRGKRRLHQTPTTADIVHYRWWLDEEIRLVDPTIVVALGATALHALSGKRQKLGAVRGTLAPWREREMLVTVHPSFLLRLPDEQARVIERGRFIRDLGEAARNRN